MASQSIILPTFGTTDKPRGGKDAPTRVDEEDRGRGNTGTDKPPGDEDAPRRVDEEGKAGTDIPPRDEDAPRPVDEKDRGRGNTGGEAKQPSSRKTGPLQTIAQKAFDDGPTEKDEPGFLYVYFEPGGTKNERKVGRTTQDSPERRMHTAVRNNGTTYKLKKSWPVRV